MNNEENKNFEDETVISLGDMWRHFIDHITTVILIVLMCAILGLFVGVSKGKTYSTSGVLSVTKGDTANCINVKNEVMEFILSDEVLNKVSEDLNVKKSDIFGKFSLSTDEKSTKINVNYTSSDDKLAVELLNSFMKNSIEVLNEKKEDQPVHPTMYEAVKIFNEANVINVSSKNKKMTAVGILLGLLIGGVYVVIITVKDDHFKDRKEIESLNIPLLGEIKSYKEVK